MKRAAVVIVTYNNPTFLGICLAAYRNQSYANFAIFIADDGSNHDTRAKIDSFRKILPQPITHVWHPDKGYRKAQIANRVFSLIDPHEFPVIINVDHDTIAHRRFVEDHVRSHANSDNRIFMGRRVNLGPKITTSFSEANVTRLNHGFPLRFLKAAMAKDIEDPNRAIRIGSNWLRKLLKRDNVPDLLGSNFSISNNLLRKVNGYNEEYKHYWGEDGDLFVRVRNAGAEISGSRSLAVQYHLYHKMLIPDAIAMKNYYEVLLPNRSYAHCANGISESQHKMAEVKICR